MKSTKTWQLLASLSVWEMKSFGELLDSPFFNKNSQAKQLFKLFLPSLQAQGGEVPSPEQAFDALFPGQPFQHPKLRYLLTDLAKLLEKFFVQKALAQDSALQDRLRLQEFRQRGLEKYFEQDLRAALSDWEATPRRDASRLLHRFFLEEIALEHAQTVHNRNTEELLPPLLHSLEQFSLAARLKYLCELLNRRNVLAATTDDALLEDVQRRLQAPDLQRGPAITLYEHVLNTLLHADDPQHYHQLRAGLHAHAQAFAHPELGQLYAFALNYCIKRLNLGDADYLRELYSLYKELIEGKILHENGILAPQHFKNIVTVAIRLEEFAWTEAFIERIQADLPPEERRNAYVYNMACLHYARKSFGVAKRLLQQVAFTDPYYQLDSRTILAKCYYELEEFEPLFSLIASFRLFLRRNKSISDYQQRLYMNMLRLMEKMAKARLDPTLPSEALIAEVEGAKEVADAAWLRKQLDALR